jgi:hypothetical protein
LIAKFCVVIPNAAFFIAAEGSQSPRMWRRQPKQPVHQLREPIIPLSRSFTSVHSAATIENRIESRAI